MTPEMTLADSMLEDDAFTAGHSLEDELLGKGYFGEAPLGSSLADELHSAVTITPPAITHGKSKLAAMAMNQHLSSPLGEGPMMAMEFQKLSDDGKIDLSKTTPFAQDDDSSPVNSPLQHWPTAMSTSTSLYGLSRRSSFSSTWSSLDAEDDDPFEVLKRRLEELNSTVWETKTLHKRLFNTLSSSESTHSSRALRFSGAHSNSAQPLELLITTVSNLLERNARDRERQTNHLRNIDNSIRKEVPLMSVETVKELESIMAVMNSTLHDQSYSYENPLPAIRSLNLETSSMTETLEELKEIMYVNKRQAQELNVRLRSIAKTVHEVRKDIRRINKLLEEKDDDDVVVLEKGEVQERVKEIMWGLDDLDEKSSRDIKQMQQFWQEQENFGSS